uniref:Tc toxin subunit A-related protein n=1 Tax=Serratia proteamaculans TaxID=28151 RepID=UPI001F4BCEED|nr:neuraminidase-like domain-containing protein [Serratia proteamaculans]ULG16701.1 SppA [Serratia proteamaculans]ULG16846.1 SppA [Serratia proteamaculans]
MYNIDDILDKVNAPRAHLSEENDTAVTLTDLFSRSFPEVKKITGDSLSWGEVRYLYRQAQKEQKENQLTESRILARANPQLANTVRLGIRQAASSRSYDDWFGSRADRFARPNTVASMFSPAAYLTELYREAKDLHPTTSQYRLDTRRPDLAQLALSQNNMDEEITTLGLSSELLLRSVGSHENLDDGAVMELLAGYRQTGMTPYHRVYEAARQAILLQDPMLQAFDRNPDVAQLMDRASLLAIESDISPVLYQILTEEITANNYAALWTKNFGDTEVSMFASPDYLARYYGIDNDTLASLLSMVSQPAGSDTGGTVILTEVDNPRNLACQVTALGDDSYRFRFTILNNFTDLGFGLLVRGASPFAFYWEDRTFPYVKDIEFSVDITVPDADFTDNMRSFNLFQGTSATNGYGISRFTITRIITTSHQEFYLKLNKVLRLYKACGITPAELLQITSSLGDALTIDHAVLSKIFQVRYLMSHYQLDVARSLVLCNGTISDQAFSGENGLFNTLFNTPPLNGQQFSADDTALDLRSEAPEDAFRLNVLKRAFNVSASGLSTLWQLARGNSSAGFTCSADNIAALYRVKLLADIHDLSVGELSMLLSVSPFSGVATGSLSDDELTQLIQFLYLTTTWLTAQGWSVSDVFLMLTTTYSTLLTPEMENLFATLRSGLSGRSFSSSDELSTAAAPLVAASTQLDSSDSAGAMLDWADALQPEGLTLADFISLVMTDAQHDEEQTARLAGFCQVLWQLSLIIRHTGLSTRELTLVVSQPGRFHAGLASLPHDLQTLRDLTRFRDTVNRCGSYAADVLTALAAGELPVSLLATAQKQDEQDVAGALTQVRGDNGQDSGVFTTWKEVDQAEQWLDMSAVLSVTPSGLARLIALKYISVSDDSAPSYSEWLAVSGLLQSGLDSSQTATLSVALEEGTSSALCAYYLHNLAPFMVSSRDDLFGYLLLDNQVSARVKTTRIAEAIASIQLYVNRALNGMENSIVAEVRGRQFFTDWDMYNKSYSTWAGVSELVYYPENYLDATARIGQTSMMNTLLQQVSQSQLNSDVVEDGFKTFLTSFEEISNLNVISGYHDNVDINEGHTYFIGNSYNTPKKYYWRSVDHGKFDNGVFPANAWTEWTEIVCAVDAWGGNVFPVIYKSRLYVLWIEKKEQGTSTNGEAEEKFYLNASHIRYDGSWEMPFSFEISSYLRLDGSKIPAVDEVGVYCSSYQGEDTLFFCVYKKQSAYAINNLPLAKGVYVFAEMTISPIDDARLQYILEQTYNQLDTLTNNRVNNLFGSTLSVDVEVNKNEPGKSYRLDPSLIDITTVSTSTGEVSISLTPKFEIRHNDNLIPPALALLFDAIPSGNGGYHLFDYESIDLNNSTVVNMMALEEAGMLTLCFIIEGSNVPNSSSDFSRLIFNNSSWPDIKLTTVQPFNGRNLIVSGLLENKTPDEFFDFCNKTGGSLYFPYKNGSSGSMIRLNMKSKKPFTLSLFRPEDIQFDITSPASLALTALASQACPRLPEFNLTRMEYTFSSVGGWTDEGLITTAGMKVLCRYSTSSVLGDTATAELTVVIKNNQYGAGNVLTLLNTSTGSQYIQLPPYRTRLNTLFARNLIERATAGIDAVLTMNTQNLPEPQLGDGSYIRVLFSPYNKDLHGNGWYKLYINGAISDGVNGEKNRYLCASGSLFTTSETQVNIFLPYFENETGAGTGIISLSVEYSDELITQMQVFHYDKLTKQYIAESENDGKTRGLNTTVLTTRTEPMDFTGANALYFWELFYYTPMMVFQRLLQEQNFPEALRWLQYIWNPAGYIVNGTLQNYTWNVRPLEEDTSWNDSPLDSVDPDAVAQNDPMHYKVATFMAYLDLQIARGDAAFRLLDRDTLNEARMWYVQALNLLGEEPYISFDADWAALTLGDAASEVTARSYQSALMAVRRQEAAPDARTANALTALFLPQQNAVLKGYWQTLAQRLYNLRHNLSIDGQPLSLSVYTTPSEPTALLNAAVSSAQGSSSLPVAVMPLYRFPVMLENARGQVSLLQQFGNTLLSITERQDAEALAELLQTQGSELVLQGLRQQDNALAEIDADILALKESRKGAQARFDDYSALYDADVNTGENQAMDLYLSSSVLTASSQVLLMAGAAAELVPNIYGMAVGGARYGALFNATAFGLEISSAATRIAADKISQSEMYRRRREEWATQRNGAESDVSSMDAQLAAMVIRREGAELQKTYLEMQQTQTQGQLAFLQSKFSNTALYNWLRGKLATIYYQFYDLTASRCLMAQSAYQWDKGNSATTFIQSGVWQGTFAGLLAGDTLMLGLSRMEQAWLASDERAKEVTRTVCLSDVYAGLAGDAAFVLADEVVGLVNAGTGSAGTATNGLKFADQQLQVTLNLADLNIAGDYPASLGNTRRIKQISVTLPALVGPYQDIRAVLSYGGSVVMPRGCTALAVSHGMNDSGQFQLDFNDPRWLPFEGIPVGDSGSLTLSFPNAAGSQQAMLLSLSDIILHIRYTITS